LKEVPMKMALVAAAAVLLVGVAQVVLAERPGKERWKDLTPLEQKLLGTWKGRTTCDGRLVFRADGTYELTEYGPAHDDSKGTWKVRWGSQPATLVLTCTASEIPGEVGKTMEVKLLQVDDKSLAIGYAHPNGRPSGHYTRLKK
jgi:hypothetical protein